MKYYLKQFMEWVTSLKRNPFEEAKLKLTGYYLLILLFVVTIFSFVVMTVIEKNLKDTLDDTVADPMARHETFERTTDSIGIAVIGIDSILLLTFGGMGYFLAGKTLKPIRKNLEAQKRFTADASHDLRTPLTIMKTGIEVTLANKSSDNSNYRKVLQSNLEEIESMSLLVDDLLALARSEGTHHKDHQTTVDYVTCLTTLVERFKIQAIAKNIDITLQTMPASILVSELNFTRALQNILTNAVHYTQTNGKIAITLHKESQHFILTISDTGIGISKEDLPYIFDRFYKASHSRNDQTGSGLGLSIAKKFIEECGGTIAVSSTLNKGTTVTIIMPGI